MKFDSIIYEVADRVATITMNRPEQMNSWTPAMSDELLLALGAADADDEVRAVIVTGAGRAFCAGADLSGGESGFKGGRPGERSGPRLWPHQVRKPVIAAINGHAVGVGITFPMLCDMRIVADEAKIQYAMTRRGIIPELGTHALLPRIIGFARAADLVLTGRVIRGTEAADLGLASRSVPATEVLDEARRVALDIAMNVAPVSAAVSKQLLWRGLMMPVDEMMALEGRLLQPLIAAPDAAEGVRAFFERRDPQWTGTVTTGMPEFDRGDRD